VRVGGGNTLLCGEKSEDQTYEAEGRGDLSVSGGEKEKGRAPGEGVELKERARHLETGGGSPGEKERGRGCRRRLLSRYLLPDWDLGGGVTNPLLKEEYKLSFGEVFFFRKGPFARKP